MIQSVVAGLLTGLGLIVAIGSQNVFVLRQGLTRRHVFAVAATATLCDAALVTIGVAGLGSAIASVGWLAQLTAIGGIAFLTGYGILSLRNSLRSSGLDWEATGTGQGSTSLAVSATLAVSLLNPHVYLDTVVLLGGIGGQLPAEARTWFTIGAVAASAIWFFSLSFGARALAPLFRKAAAQRLLDLFVATVMFAVAAFLAWELLAP